MFDNEPTSRPIDLYEYMGTVYALDADSYAGIQDLGDGYTVRIFNQKDERIALIELSDALQGTVCGIVKDGDKLVLLYSTYLPEDDSNAMAVSVFDMEGRCLETHDLFRLQTWKAPEGWTFAKTDWGYIAGNTTSQQPYSLWFLNEDFELISSMQAPDSLCSGTYMGLRCVVKWYDITINGYRAAITKPFAAKNTSVTPGGPPEKDEPESSVPSIPEGPPKEDEPESSAPSIPEGPTEEGPEESEPSASEESAAPESDRPSEEADGTASPDTADTGHIALFCLALLLSAGGILVCCLKKRQKASA